MWRGRIFHITLNFGPRLGSYISQTWKVSKTRIYLSWHSLISSQTKTVHIFFQINVHVSTSYLWNLGMFNSPLFADFWSQSRQCWPWHGQADAGEDVWSAGKMSSMQRLSWKHSVPWFFNVSWPLLLHLKKKHSLKSAPLRSKTSFPIKRLVGGGVLVLGSRKKKEERIVGFGEILASPDLFAI